ncbi:hypothetical protein FIBSPDRAFT_876684 [Athelia psychrophila]|uniref:Uncharacterized protein n=1 Tax=Athelia psychrophila TaxID=1759441 RepID=A0A167WMB4_9AGAM|nr:hypothetical protein FIBSPDRAFT_876684 [Fibularhizoctonia sp. CBS 109695]
MPGRGSPLACRTPNIQWGAHEGHWAEHIWQTDSAKQPELHAYWSDLTAQHDVRPHITFNTYVVGMGCVTAAGPRPCADTTQRAGSVYPQDDRPRPLQRCVLGHRHARRVRRVQRQAPAAAGGLGADAVRLVVPRGRHVEGDERVPGAGDAVLVVDAEAGVGRL